MGYLRLRNIFPPSSNVPVTYSNPASTNLTASFVFVATFTMKSSPSEVSKSIMYLRVVLGSLCPSNVWT